MLTATVRSIAEITAGEVLAGSLGSVVSGVAIDSRTVTSGGAFIAFPGERTDGHDFVADALARGAHVILVTRPDGQLNELLALAQDAQAAVIRVVDAARALQDLARYYRSRLRCEVVGITGSTGKTSTKDLLVAALSETLNVAFSVGNRNNELGVPLSVLQADAEADVLIAEMGMRGLGQIDALCDIAHPRVGLITNVGTSHIEILGNQDAIAEAKSELLKCLPADGMAFLNGDDAYSDTLRHQTMASVTLYGLSDECDVRGAEIELDDQSRASFTILTPVGSARVALSMPGRHNIYNALAAAAVAIHLGVPLESVVDGLSKASLSAMRMEVFVSASGNTVINDAYNANPVSMRAAIETLAEMSASGRRIAVLGDMAELGSLTELAHFRIGEQVARLGIDLLIAVGPRAVHIAEGATAEGMASNQVMRCENAGEAAKLLAELLEQGDTVLVKASRVMGLEMVVERIVSAL